MGRRGGYKKGGGGGGGACEVLLFVTNVHLRYWILIIPDSKSRSLEINFLEEEVRTGGLMTRRSFGFKVIYVCSIEVFPDNLMKCPKI